MLTVFRILLDPLLYMFLFIALGLGLRKLKALPDNAAAVLSRLESDFIIPGVILNSFIRHCTVESIRSYAKPMLLCAGLVILLIFLAGPLSKLFEKEGYYRNLYRFQMIFNSWGFMGYALVRTLFGSEALYQYILFTLPMSIGCYMYGVPLLTPQKEGAASKWKNLINPSMIAVVCGAALGLLGFEKVMPAFLSNVLTALADMYSPVAMLLVGLTIGGFSLRELFLDRKAWLACLFRMILVPPVLVAVAFLAGAKEQLILYTLFLAVMPLGLFSVIYPPRFGKDARPGASMVLVSYLLCMITIPLFYAMLDLLTGVAL